MYAWNIDYIDVERLQEEFVIVEKCIVYNVTYSVNISGKWCSTLILFWYQTSIKDAFGTSHISKHDKWITSYFAFIMLMTEALVLGVGIGISQFQQWLLRIFKWPNPVLAFLKLSIFEDNLALYLKKLEFPFTK